MREWFWLECGGCKRRNYRAPRRTGAGAPKLALSKYCRWCRKHTEHVERKK